MPGQVRLTGQPHQTISNSPLTMTRTSGLRMRALTHPAKPMKRIRTRTLMKPVRTKRPTTRRRISVWPWTTTKTGPRRMMRVKRTWIWTLTMTIWDWTILRTSARRPPLQAPMILNLNWMMTVRHPRRILTFRRWTACWRAMMIHRWLTPWSFPPMN